MQITVKKGDVIQINDKFCGAPDWIGCLMIVDEVKDWGVLAYLHVPTRGEAYLRLKHGQYEIIGEAVFVIGNDKK